MGEGRWGGGGCGMNVGEWEMEREVRGENMGWGGRENRLGVRCEIRGL